MPSAWPRGHKHNLDLDALTFDPALQVRQGGEEEWHAEQLAESVKRGEQLPQVQVIRVKDGDHAGDHVIDGRHTCRAARLAGRKTVVCNVRGGTWEDAVLEAARANRQHNALPLKPPDKRRAVLMVLAVHPDWSDKRVAAHIGHVSDRFVASVRPEKPAEVTGRDGKTYKKAAAPARKETPEKDDAPANGEAPFTWADFEEPFGRAVRAIDRRAKDAQQYPDSLDAEAAKRLLAELADLTKKWAARDKKAAKEAGK